MSSHNREVYEKIFGGSDSELSEEDDEPPRRLQSPQAPAGDDYESTAPSENEEEFVQDKPRRPKTKRRTKVRDEEDGEPRRASKKRKRQQALTAEDLSELPPEQARKLQIDMQIEAILKPKNAQRPKKRKNDEDILDRFADEEVARLREAMLAAAEDDETSNKLKMPATAKLKLLPKVEEVLLKSSLAQSIIDNNLLEGVRRWLEPLPDKSLPALNIQRTFFETLDKMGHIDTSSLKESKLGRVVLFYTKCKRVTPAMQRLAHKLVSSWSRPIIKRSANYRDRPMAITQVDMSTLQRDKLHVINQKMRMEDAQRVKKNAVMVPRREMGTYTVAPDEMAGVRRQDASIDLDTERRRKNAERLRSLTRKMASKS